MVISYTKEGSKPKNMVQTIERIAVILDTLRQNPDGASVKNISEKAKLPMGTTHRLLASLLYFGFVAKDPSSKRYHLGFKLVELGNARLEQIDLRTVARPYLKHLAHQAKESVHLAILDEYEALYLDRIDSSENRHGLQMASKVGMRIKAHCSGTGKVMLAALSEDELNLFFKAKGIPKKTENTITDADKLKEHLERVRKQGYAVDDEEDDLGTRCVAAPIRNESGKVVAAISISGPTIRITRKRALGMFKDQIIETAMIISRQLGYREDGEGCTAKERENENPNRMKIQTAMGERLDEEVR